MLSPNYNLSDIQSSAFYLNLQTNHLFYLFAGAAGELTPQMIIDQFVELDQSYQLLKSRVDAVQQSIDSGHDPDRWLLLP